MSYFTQEGTAINDYYPKQQSSFHLLFCDVANHGDGMQKVGNICDSGFTNENLLRYYQNLTPGKASIYNIKDCLPTTLYQIPDCYVLVIKDYFKDQVDEIQKILSTKESSDESGITGVNWDTERISGLKLLHNKLGNKLIFCELDNNWKYPFSPHQNVGTIYNTRFIPSLFSIQRELQNQLGYLPVIDGTYFYDLNECYTPFHQVKDRKKLVGLGIGETQPLQFRWFHGSTVCSDTMSIPIEHGDLYIISQSAAGIQKEKQTKLYLKYGIGTNKALFN